MGSIVQSALLHGDEIEPVVKVEGVCMFLLFGGHTRSWRWGMGKHGELG